MIFFGCKNYLRVIFYFKIKMRYLAFLLFYFAIANATKTLSIRANDCFQEDPNQYADFITDYTDDQIEFQKAINIISAAGGGDLYLERCDYVFSDRLVMKSNVNIRGGFSSMLIFQIS